MTSYTETLCEQRWNSFRLIEKVKDWFKERKTLAKKNKKHTPVNHEVAALSPRLKKDLGLNEEGKPLDIKP